MHQAKVNHPDKSKVWVTLNERVMDVDLLRKFERLSRNMQSFNRELYLRDLKKQPQIHQLDYTQDFHGFVYFKDISAIYEAIRTVYKN